jgi:hypothetical protein
MSLEAKWRALQCWAAHFEIYDQGTHEDIVFADFQLYNNTTRNTAIYKTREEAININYIMLSDRIYELADHIDSKKARLKNAP